MKKFFLNLLLSFFILALCLLAIEIFLRTTHAFGARISWSQPDPVLGWRFIPNAKIVHLGENPKPVVWTTNSDGWKDKNWSLDKPAGTYRVAVLGDSYVEAAQVETEKIFLSQVEKRLQAAGRKTEWMNFGRSAFTQAEEWLVLKNDIARFKPDLVILFFYPVNDIDDLSPETASDLIRPFYRVSENDQLELDTSFKNTKSYRLKSLISPFKRRSALISLFTQRMTLLQASRLQEKKKESEGLQGYLSLATSTPNPVYVKNYGLSKRLIREMVSFSRQEEMKFMLVSIDTPAYLPEEEARLKAQDPSFKASFFDQDLEAFASGLQIDFLGLEKPFREYYAKTGRVLHWPMLDYQGRPIEEYAGHTGHWNEEGHALVAELLEKRLNLV